MQIKVVKFDNKIALDTNKLEEELNKLRDEGWEVVSTYYIYLAGILMVILRKVL